MVTAVIISTECDLQSPNRVEGEKIGQTLWHSADLAYALIAALKIKPSSLLWNLEPKEFVLSGQFR
jgi:hypothetical protein